MTTDRRTVSLSAPPGGWASPWPCAFELARVLPTTRWTLIGGAMVQLHALGHNIHIVRPTDDLDLLLHIEVDSDIARDAHRSITQLGYELREPTDPRSKAAPHYRYLRRHTEGMQKIDVMVADHAAPRAAQRLQGRPMFAVDGGTQALKRTMIYQIADDESEVEFSVPDELGALVLKGAAHLVDNRDADRHLQDAAVLAACIHDHAAEIRRLQGSDSRRIAHLARELTDPAHSAWLALADNDRITGQDTLRILGRFPTP